MTQPPTVSGRVALFNASDDTIDMIVAILKEAGTGQYLRWVHFADLKKGIVNFDVWMTNNNPEVVIFDLSPPYDANWTFFKTMRDSETMQHRGCVLTTTNKDRLDEVLGHDSHALEVVGRDEDLRWIADAIQRETARAAALRSPLRPVA